MPGKGFEFPFIEEPVSELVMTLPAAQSPLRAWWCVNYTALGCSHIAPPSQFHVHFSGSTVTWAQARAACQSHGGDLASIHSQAENDAAHALLLEAQSRDASLMYVYFGLHDRTEDLAFVWSDTTAVDYTNWESSEPNHGDNNEDCAGFLLDAHFQDMWVDYPCDGEAYWVPGKPAFGYLCSGPHREITQNVG
jgi:Lectin C-type domain.